MRTISETTLASLPSIVQDLVVQHIGKDEKVVLCLLFQGRGEGIINRVMPDSGTPSAAVITDYRLIVTNLSGFTGPIKIPNSLTISGGQPVYVFGLEKIKSVAIGNPSLFSKSSRLYVDVGAKTIKSDPSDIPSVDNLEIDFGENVTLLQKTRSELTRVVADAFTRARTPASKPGAVPDIGDQLMKLAQLRKDNAITETEYEAAKRKLLS